MKTIINVLILITASMCSPSFAGPGPAKSGDLEKMLGVCFKSMDAYIGSINSPEEKPPYYAIFKTEKGKLFRDFYSIGYDEDVYPQEYVATPMVTTRYAFFYHEPCDICGDLERCDLKTGEIKTLEFGHGGGCSDLVNHLTDMEKGEKVISNVCAMNNYCEILSRKAAYDDFSKIKLPEGQVYGGIESYESNDAEKPGKKGKKYNVYIDVKEKGKKDPLKSYRYLVTTKVLPTPGNPKGKSCQVTDVSLLNM